MLVAAGYLAIYLLVVGIAAGWFAWVVLGKNKALSKGRRQPNGPLLLVLGVVGSFVGGLGMSVLSGEGFALRPGGMIGSAVGAVAVAAGYVWFQGRKA